MVTWNPTIDQQLFPQRPSIQKEILLGKMVCVSDLKCILTWFLASQMWLLGRILPLVIGDYVPEDDEHWRLYLQMMDIVDILFAPSTSDDYAAYVATLISDHHHDFCRLYLHSSILPKMHFMVHMPRLMIE